jgi:hypothetical protein
MPSDLEISLTMPPPTRNFSPPRSSTLAIGRLVLNTMPGPWVKKASTLTPWCSAVNSGYLAAMRLYAMERGSEVLPRNGISAIWV